MKEIDRGVGLRKGITRRVAGSEIGQQSQAERPEHKGRDAKTGANRRGG